ncbi:MAG: hypothetical protein KGL39_14590 [Patescibacteria group bacterium]|nr:hypothetical protein [Patescibacteria group bacterium]
MKDTANDNPREQRLEMYFIACCKARGWETRKLQWMGRRGAADRIVLTGCKPCPVEFVELKRPRGGVVSVHQSEDANLFAHYGIKKHFLYTREAIDKWFARFREYAPNG